MRQWQEEVTMRGTAATGAASGKAGALPRKADAPHGKADTQRLTEILDPIVMAVGMDLESVRVTRAGRRLLVRVVVDSDNGVSLDDAADISRAVSAELDATDAMGDVPYTLEVSSPGVDRPLTEPKHWRRAAGRLVKVGLLSDSDGKTGDGQLTGRVTAADGDGVTLEVDGQRRSFSYDELGAGSIQVEFGRLESVDNTDSET
jgi:ribosome maturation factor RimP